MKPLSSSLVCVFRVWLTLNVVCTFILLELNRLSVLCPLRDGPVAYVFLDAVCAVLPKTVGKRRARLRRMEGMQAQMIPTSHSIMDHREASAKSQVTFVVFAKWTKDRRRRIETIVTLVAPLESASPESDPGVALTKLQHRTSRIRQSFS